MVNKNSYERTMAGVLPERSRLYNVAFPASGASFVDGATWPFPSIRRGLEKRSKDVKELAPAEANNRRFLAATDRISELRFIALMTHANTARDDIASMLYVSVFTGIAMNDDWADRIDRHLAVTAAWAEDGDLYLASSPNIVSRFDENFFDDQLMLFLDDMRNALRLLLDDGEHRNAVAKMLKAFMNGSDSELGAFRNALDAQRFQIPRQVTMFGPRHECKACKGKGRRMFRTCQDCNGIGFTR